MKIKDLQIKLKNLLPETINKAMYEELGATAAVVIKERTRKGQGVATPQGNLEKLKALSPKYIKRRQKMRNLSSETTPSKSNLTKTGDMLDNIKSKATSSQATVFIAGKKNNDAAKYGEKDRPFMNLSKSEYNKLVNFIKEKIKTGIKKQGL
jgi:hypothetical protein